MGTLTTRKGEVILVDDSDIHMLSQFTWYLTKGRTQYVRGSVEGKIVSMHRLLMGFPEGQLVDHANGNTLDNRRVNLRICSSAENARNRAKHRGLHKAKGVYKVVRSSNWRARVCVEGKQIWSSPMPYADAVKEYNRMALEHFGPYARLNSIDTV